MATPGKPTQDFVPINDIRSGVMILKDGSYRMMLLTSSINFGLKSRDEQTAIIAQFQDFLNSIEYSLQIFIQSKRFDIKPYLMLLEERQKAQLLDIMKVQVMEYIQFIKGFTDQVNIMSKTFIVVVPYSPRSAVVKGNAGPLGGLFGGSKDKKRTSDESFEENRIQLEQRVSTVEQGLSRCGLRTHRLGTEEITELFYNKFNPGDLDAAIAK
jgi:hypothetical protein